MGESCFDKYVNDIRHEEEERTQLLKRYTPFIAARVSKYYSSNSIYDKDEMLEIAYLAFDNAIKNYDNSKGSFLNFADVAVKNRLIDYTRMQNKRNKSLVYIEDYSYQDSNANTVINNNSINKYQVILENEARAIEIREITAELRKYNIEFKDLANISPSHKRTKKMCANIVKSICIDKEQVFKIRKSGRLPLVDIEEIVGYKRKQFERYRKYIITMVIVFSGDYPFIREYLKDF